MPETPRYDTDPADRLLLRHRELDYPYECVFGRARVVVREGTFCPALTNTSPFLLQHIDWKSGERVLDMFCGSGAFALNAALSGAAAVVAIDSSATACATARSNAELNEVAGLIDVRCGTLRSARTPGERFDLIIANPPLLPGLPWDSLSAALWDPDFGATRELIQLLPAMLEHNGRALLLTSDVMSRYGVSLSALAGDAGLSARLVASRDVGYEHYRVHRLAIA